MAADTRIEVLADWLEKQALDSSITDGTIWNKMGLSKSSFYRLKPKALSLVNTRAMERQKQIERTKAHEIKEAVKSGLKSKTERILNLQKQIEDIQADLDANSTFEYMVVQGTVQKVTRPLTPTEKALLRRSIKYIQSEISKIEGDYAPKKIQELSPDTVLVPGEDDE